MDTFEAMLKRILNECYESFNIRLIVGEGSVYESLLDTGRYYSEVLAAIESKGSNKSDIILYSNIPQGEFSYYYPLLTSKVINCVLFFYTLQE